MQVITHMIWIAVLERLASNASKESCIASRNVMMLTTKPNAQPSALHWDCPNVQCVCQPSSNALGNVVKIPSASQNVLLEIEFGLYYSAFAIPYAMFDAGSKVTVRKPDVVPVRTTCQLNCHINGRWQHNSSPTMSNLELPEKSLHIKGSLLAFQVRQSASNQSWR